MKSKFKVTFRNRLILKACSVFLSLTIFASAIPAFSLPVYAVTQTNVSLGSPSFINTSHFCFSSASVSGSTITSITVTATSSTVVVSLPLSPVPAMTLSNSSGTTCTKTYVFTTAISAFEAQGFLRGMVFNFSSNAAVTVTADGNNTHLPSGACITQLTPSDDTKPHYYMFVNSTINWQNAYNAAKGYVFMGRKGYLATITSSAEDAALTNISSLAAWSGGTRLAKNSSLAKITDESSLNSLSAGYVLSQFYWSCGPEAGNIYNNSATSAISYNGSYIHWNSGEPNNWNSSENCMQVNAGDNIKCWNDLNLTDTTNGYFVEFSDYAGGWDTSYSSLLSGSASCTLPANSLPSVTFSTAAPTSLIYDGQSKAFTVSVTGAALTAGTDYLVSYSGRNSTSYSSSATAPVYPGDYTLTILLTATGAAKATLASPYTQNFSISKAILTPIGISNISKYYDGSLSLSNPGTVSFTGLVGSDNVGISCTTAIFDSTAVGNGKTITVSGLSLSGSVSAFYALSVSYFTVSNGMILANMPGAVTEATFADKTVTYNGSPQSNTISNLPLGVSAVIYSYQGIGATSYGPSSISPTDAGTFRVTATFAMETGYSQLSAVTKNLTINKATVTVSGITAKDKVYDGRFSAELDFSAAVLSGKISGDNLFVTAFGSFTDKNTGDVVTVNLTGLTLIGLDSGNYALSASGQQALTFAKITKKPVTVVLAVLDKQYDGLNTASYNGTPSLSGILSGDTVTLSAGVPYFSSVGVGNNISVVFTAFSLSGADRGNYSLTEPSGITASITNTYRAVKETDYTINSNSWQNGDFVVTAKAGFLLSNGNTDSSTWAQTLSFANETSSGSVVFYVRNTANKAISLASTETYQIDRTKPEGDIKIDSNSIKKLINALSFGLFFKNSVTVTISGSDSLSGVFSVQYLKTSVALSDTDLPSKVWTGAADTSMKTFTASPNDKFIVYGKITDKAGNIAYINSDGIVLYTDSVKATENISFVKLSSSAVDASVTLNGNLIKDIFNGSYKLIKDIDYSISGNVISFSAAYLNLLSAGDYTFTVSYLPQGEQYEDVIGNAAPATTAITLAVLKTAQAPVFITGMPVSITYGDSFTVSYSGGSGDGSVSYSSTNTSVATVFGNMVTIVGVGSFAITVNKLASTDGVYLSTTKTSESKTAVKKELTITGLKATDRQYNGTIAVSLTGGTLVGIVGSDNVNCVMPVTGNADSKNIGTRIVSFIKPSLTGSKSVNYYLNLPEVTVAISKKQITVLNTAVSDKVYDGSIAAQIINIGVLSVNYDGDKLMIVKGSAAFATKNVSASTSVSFTGFSITGLESGNYQLVSQPESVTAAITPAAITVTPKDSQSKYYGENDPIFNYSYSGNISGETPAFDGTLNRKIGEEIGGYELLLGSLSIKDNSVFLSENYTVALDTNKVNFKIKEYTTEFAAFLNNAQGQNGWYTAEVILTAPDGFEISRSSELSDNVWNSSITLDSTDSSTKTFSYYLKSKATGAITTLSKAVHYKVDSHSPVVKEETLSYNTVNTGLIANIGRFLTFGNFFKQSVKITVEVADIGDSTAEKLIYVVTEEKKSELLKESSEIKDNKAELILPLNTLKNKTVNVDLYVVDKAGNEGKHVILNGNATKNSSWYFSDDASTIGSFTVDGNMLTEAAELDKLAVTVSSAIKDMSGIYKISYKIDNLTNFVEISSGLGTSCSFVTEYTFEKQFNSPGQHFVELLVENNVGNTVTKNISFSMKEQQNAKKLTVSASGCAYFEGEEIKLSDLRYSITGHSRSDSAGNVADTTGMMAVIDGKPITGDSFTLDKGTHVLSFTGITAKDYSIEYVQAEIIIFKKLTVSFLNTDGQKLFDDVTVQPEQLLPIPPEPVKAGSAFVGWSATSDSETLWNFAFDTVNANTALYAVWSDKVYSVSISKNDGSPDMIYSSVAYGKRLTEPEKPVVEGASFSGWYKDSAFTAFWDFAKDIVTENTAIFAKITKDTYTVSFAPIGSETKEPITRIYYDQLVRPIPTSPTASGKIFAGWYLDKELKKAFDFAFDTVKENVTLYPKWVDKTYTVFGAVADSSGNVSPGSTVKILQNQAILATATADENGLFRFTQVPKGSYSLTATDGKKSANTDITITNADILELVLSLPCDSVSVAAKKSEAGGISFKKLDKIINFQSGSYLTVSEQRTLRDCGKIEINVNALDEKKMPAEKVKEMRNYISSLGKLSGECYDVTIEKLIYDKSGKMQTGYISQTDQPVEIKILLSSESRKRNNYRVIREHGGQMQILTTEPVDGEYFELKGNEIVIHAKKFSSFAVAFDKQFSPLWAWLLAVAPLIFLLLSLYLKNKERVSKGKAGGR